MADALSHLIVDARTVCHPTGGPRGIGRYVIGLLDGLRQVDAPVIALYETQEQQALLTRAVPDVDLRSWSPAVVRDLTAPGSWYLATQLMLHPIPLDPVPRIITDSRLPVAAIMYDVIRERYPELYQVRAESRAQVLLRGMLARTLDALLAISDWTADTAAQELRFPRDRIATIGAGVDPKFAPAVDDPWPRLKGVLRDDERGIVVTVTGEDPRKNTARLVRAWAMLPQPLRSSHRLVVIGDPADAETADAGTADIDFTGEVTDEQLIAIYQVAELAVMPSTEEGFGLPALEAAACGCAVLTSNVSALPEVFAEPAAQFDPYDVTAMAAAIERALTDAPHRELLVTAARRATQRWTWANVGHAVVMSLQELGPRRVRQLRTVPQRVAVSGTFDDSAIGRANTSRVDEMGKQSPLAEITLLVDNSANDNATHAGPLRFPVRALGRFVPRSQFDDVIRLDA